MDVSFSNSGRMIHMVNQLRGGLLFGNNGRPDANRGVRGLDVFWFILLLGVFSKLVSSPCCQCAGNWSLPGDNRCGLSPFWLPGSLLGIFGRLSQKVLRESPHRSVCWMWVMHYYLSPKTHMLVLNLHDAPLTVLLNTNINHAKKRSLYPNDAVTFRRKERV